MNILNKSLLTSTVKVLISGLVVFSVSFNTLCPKFSLEQKEYDVLSQIMQSQSELLSFFSFATLPMKIVNDLFASQKTRPDKTKSENRSKAQSTSSDFSIANSEKRLNDTRLERQGFIKLLFAGYFSEKMLLSCKINFSPGSSICGEIRSVCRMFMILLPRSGLADNAILVNNINYKNPSV